MNVLMADAADSAAVKAQFDGEVAMLHESLQRAQVRCSSLAVVGEG